MRVRIARRPIRGLARPSRGGTFAGLLAGILIGLGTALSVAIFVTKAPVPFLNKATRAPERALDPKTPETAPDPNKPLFSRNRADPSSSAATEPSILFPGPDRSAPKSTDRQGAESEVDATPSAGSASGSVSGSASGSAAGIPARSPASSANSTQMPPTVLAPAVQAPNPSASAPARAPTTAQGATVMSPAAPPAPPSPPTQAAAPVPGTIGVTGASPTSGEGYVLQAGAFRTVEDAEAMRGRLALLGFEARVIGSEVNGLAVQRVRIGPFARMEDMNRARTKLTESGIEVSVVRVR